MAANLEHTNTK